jgi:phosphoglycolate phosphatase
MSRGYSAAGPPRCFATGTVARALQAPHRDLRKLLRISRHASNEVIFVGDEIRDADAAREAGIPFGAVAWGFTHLRCLEARAAAVTFCDPSELVTKLTRSAEAGAAYR